MSFVDSQPSVDGQRKMGTMGYCMGGPITMRTAAAVPDREVPEPRSTAAAS